jgi:hypothetical protein
MKFQFPKLVLSPSVFHIYKWNERRKYFTHNSSVQRSYIHLLFKRYNINIYEDLSRLKTGFSQNIFHSKVHNHRRSFISNQLRLFNSSCILTRFSLSQKPNLNHDQNDQYFYESHIASSKTRAKYLKTCCTCTFNLPFTCTKLSCL